MSLVKRTSRNEPNVTTYEPSGVASSHFEHRRPLQGTIMRSLLRHCLSKNVALVLALATGAPTSVIAKDEAVPMPNNAQAKSYGDGWECIRGFRESKGHCTKINVPSNAYPTRSSYGRSWACRRGFKLQNEACVAIKVPVHGYLASYGDKWKCNRGYVAVDDDCVVVKVPANAHLSDDSYGPGWKCRRGFAAIKKVCVAIILPANAHLNSSGTSWECDRSYEQKQGKCVEP